MNPVGTHKFIIFLFMSGHPFQLGVSGAGQNRLCEGRLGAGPQCACGWGTGGWRSTSQQQGFESEEI